MKKLIEKIAISTFQLVLAAALWVVLAYSAGVALGGTVQIFRWGWSLANRW